MKPINFAIIALAVAGFSSAVYADTSVLWTAPPDGTVFPVGTIVDPTGQASARGVIGGSGIDLALVIDVSGSMAGGGIAAAKSASVALINALPSATTSVTIIRFNSAANTVQQLSPLTTDKATLIAAVNGLTTGGGTSIGSGINVATTELTSVRHTAGRSQQMVVLSDGVSSGTPSANADAAATAGIDAIHSVGVPGHNVAQMKAIVDGPDGVFGNTDDYGVYTSGALDDLTALFAGTGGNLVGLDKVEVTLPDGTTSVVPTDGLGNFEIPGTWAIVPGPQTFIAKAYASDGTTDTRTLTLIGQRASSVPDVGGTGMLLGLCVGGMMLVRHRR